MLTILTFYFCQFLHQSESKKLPYALRVSVNFALIVNRKKHVRELLMVLAPHFGFGISTLQGLQNANTKKSLTKF